MPQADQKIPTIKSETASKTIFVSQIFWRGIGWASRLENVPELISSPKELSASITVIAPQNTKASKNHHQSWSEPSGLNRKKKFGKASAQQMPKLGSSRRISFLTSGFMVVLLSPGSRPLHAGR